MKMRMNLVIQWWVEQRIKPRNVEVIHLLTSSIDGFRMNFARKSIGSWNGSCFGVASSENVYNIGDGSSRGLLGMGYCWSTWIRIIGNDISFDRNQFSLSFVWIDCWRDLQSMGENHQWSSRSILDRSTRTIPSRSIGERRIKT